MKSWVMRWLLGCVLGGGTLGAGWTGATAMAQSVQPLITEYNGKAEGKFALRNDSLEPMVVVLEPRSFDVTAEGKGMYRPLDAGIHVQLSAMSVRLEPQQTYYIFYKANAERLPAWFTVYATFSSPKHSDGLDVRLMLPHTVYMYQKQPLELTDVRLSGLHFDAGRKQLTGTLSNASDRLARVQGVKASNGQANGEASGFPLMPGGTRHFEVEWTANTPPSQLEFRFKNFTLKQPVTLGSD